MIAIAKATDFLNLVLGGANANFQNFLLWWTCKKLEYLFYWFENFLRMPNAQF